MIGIIDYGVGNIRSVANAIREIGGASIYVSHQKQIKELSALILPGVGSFRAMMAYLNRLDLVDPIRDWIKADLKFLGICLGYQALFEKSEEAPGVEGLGVLKGNVVKYRQGKVPQIGWNEVIPVNGSFIQREYYYFVNSYYPVPEMGVRAAMTDYHGEFVSAVMSGNLLATQFHPERSGRAGLNLLQRWFNAD